MTRVLILSTLAVMLLATPASARCIMSYCKDGATTRSHITNTHRQIVGDLYDPGHNRRIIGYIERDGSITNTNRQPAGSVQDLRE